MQSGLSEHEANVREYYGKRLHNEQAALIDSVILKLRNNPELVSDTDIRSDLQRISEIEDLFERGGLDQLVDADLKRLTFLDRLQIVGRRFWPLISTGLIGLLSAVIASIVWDYIKALNLLSWISIGTAYAASSTPESYFDRGRLTLVLMIGGFVFLLLNCIFWSLVLVFTSKAKTFELAARMVTGTFTFLTGALTGWFGRGGA